MPPSCHRPSPKRPSPKPPCRPTYLSRCPPSLTGPFAEKLPPSFVSPRLASCVVCVFSPIFLFFHSNSSLFLCTWRLSHHSDSIRSTAYTHTRLRTATGTWPASPTWRWITLVLLLMFLAVSLMRVSRIVQLLRPLPANSAFAVTLVKPDSQEVARTGPVTRAVAVRLLVSLLPSPHVRMRLFFSQPSLVVHLHLHSRLHYTTLTQTPLHFLSTLKLDTSALVLVTVNCLY